jgi:hypothetical protein
MSQPGSIGPKLVELPSLWASDLTNQPDLRARSTCDGSRVHDRKVAFAIGIQFSYACIAGSFVAARFGNGDTCHSEVDCVAGTTCQFNDAKIGNNQRLDLKAYRPGLLLALGPAAHGRGARRGATEHPGDPLRNAVVFPARR